MRHCYTCNAALSCPKCGAWYISGQEKRIFDTLATGDKLTTYEISWKCKVSRRNANTVLLRLYKDGIIDKGRMENQSIWWVKKNPND